MTTTPASDAPLEIQVSGQITGAVTGTFAGVIAITPDQPEPPKPEPPKPEPPEEPLDLPPVDPPKELRQRAVSSYDALKAALGDARPGDHLVLASKEYAGAEIVVPASLNGTDENPIVIRSATGNDAGIKFKFTVLGKNVWLYRLQFLNGGTVQIATGSFITRCRLEDATSNLITFGVKGQPDGRGGRCGYNDITVRPFVESDPAGSCRFGVNVLDGQPLHTGARIFKNLFHDFSAKPKPKDYGSGYNHPTRVGDAGATLAKCAAIIEYNLYVDCDPEDSICEVKTCDNILRFNTIDDCHNGLIVVRNGQRNQVYGNTGLNDVLGIRILDKDNVVTSNDMSDPSLPDSAVIALMAGDVPAETASTTHQPPATNTVCVDNRGRLLVGEYYRAQILPCTGTLVEAHQGKVEFPSHPSNDPDNDLQKKAKAATTIHETTTRKTYKPVRLTKAQVGPEADLP